LPRLFLATYVNESSQFALEKLTKSNAKLETSWNCRIKWSKPNQFHLTWIFFGDVELGKTDYLVHLVARIIKNNQQEFQLQPEDCSLTYKKLQCWFNSGTPNLIAIVPDQTGKKLSDYLIEVRFQLADFAASTVRIQAKRPFRPHITLARLAGVEKGSSNLPLGVNDEMPLEVIDGLTTLLPLTQVFNTVSLIESKEIAGSHQYKTIADFSLF
jgi:2'-5' RNA ligase